MSCAEVKPLKQHEWLQGFVGTWSYEGSCDAGPGQPPMTFKGTETVRSLGGFWIVGESTGAMPDGSAATMILTVGFNPQTGRFVGTWIGSMMDHLWVYDGHLDAAERVLTLEATGPVMGDPTKTTKYRDITEFKNADLRAFRSEMLGPDGAWVQLMGMEFRRVK